MSSSSHPKAMYIWIFVVLAVLTAVEVWAALTLGGTAKWLLLIILAATKAGCVGYWYMHLKQEMPWLKMIALLPLTAAVYAIVLINEVAAR